MSGWSDNLITGEVGTTVEAPLCPSCKGNGYYRDYFKDATLCCEACKGEGYELGDTASLLASCPPDEDDYPLGLLFLDAKAEILSLSRYDRVEVVAE